MGFAQGVSAAGVYLLICWCIRIPSPNFRFSEQPRESLNHSAPSGGVTLSHCHSTRVDYPLRCRTDTAALMERDNISHRTVNSLPDKPRPLPLTPPPSLVPCPPSPPSQGRRQSLILVRSIICPFEPNKWFHNRLRSFASGHTDN